MRKISIHCALIYSFLMNFSGLRCLRSTISNEEWKNFQTQTWKLLFERKMSSQIEYFCVFFRIAILWSFPLCFTFSCRWLRCCAAVFILPTSCRQAAAPSVLRQSILFIRWLSNSIASSSSITTLLLFCSVQRVEAIELTKICHSRRPMAKKIWLIDKHENKLISACVIIWTLSVHCRHTCPFDDERKTIVSWETMFPFSTVSSRTLLASPCWFFVFADQVTRRVPLLHLRNHERRTAPKWSIVGSNADESNNQWSKQRCFAVCLLLINRSSRWVE